MPQNFEFGLDTFGDITIGPDGQMRSHGQVIRDVIDEGVLADELGMTPSGSASTIVQISRCRRRKWCWRQSPGAPGGSGSAPR